MYINTIGMLELFLNAALYDYTYYSFIINVLNVVMVLFLQLSKKLTLSNFYS